MTLFYGERISAKSIATGLYFAAPTNQQPDIADNGERDQKPPSRSIDVVKAPRRNGESRHTTVQGMLNAELSDTAIPCAEGTFSKAGDPRYFWTEHIKSHSDDISLTWF